MLYTTLMAPMMRYYHDTRFSEHAVKVFAYALGIGEGERLGAEDLEVLCTAALLHDIGIPQAVREHGSAAGPYQEAQGARIAPELLVAAGCPAECIPRIVDLIAHHHSPEYARDNPLLRMLMEADALVNLAEGNMPGPPESVRDELFCTATGLALLEALFSKSAF